MTLDPTVVTTVGGVIVAFITGLVTYLTTKKKSNTDVQSSLNAGFGTLITELQEERTVLRAERGELTAMVVRQNARIRQLENRVNQLLLVTTTFHNFIITSGLTPPVVEDTGVPTQDESVGPK